MLVHAKFNYVKKNIYVLNQMILLTNYEKIIK